MYNRLMSDILINADLWSDKPEILSAELDFDTIFGGVYNYMCVYIRKHM